MSIKSLKTVNYVVIAKYLHKNDDRKVQCVYHLNRAIASKIFLDLGGGLFNPGGSFLKSFFHSPPPPVCLKKFKAPYQRQRKNVLPIILCCQKEMDGDCVLRFPDISTSLFSHAGVSVNCAENKKGIRA